MEPNKYTSLDKVFQQRINPSQDENAWNVPPDFILDNALDQIDSKDNENRKYFWLYFLSIGVIAAFAIFIISTNSKVNSLQEQFDEVILQQNSELTLEKGIGQVQNPTNEIETKKVELANSTTEIAKAKVTTSNPINHKAPVAKNRKLSSTLGTGKIAASTPIVPTNNVVLSTTLNQSNIAKATSSINMGARPLSIATPKDALSVLSLLSIRKQSLIVDREEINLPFAFSVLKDHQSTRKPIFFLSAGLNSSSFSMKNVSSSVAQLTKYDERYLGYGLEAGFRLPLTNRLDFSPSIGISKVNNSSYFTEEMQYDQADEMTIDYHVESPMGSLNRSATLGQPLTHDDLLMNKTDISNSFNILGLQANLRYALIRVKKLDLGIQGGLGINYIISQSQTMNTKLYHEADMLLEENYSSLIRKEINPIYSSASVALDLRYQLNQRIFFGASFGGEKSLSSLRKTTTNSNVKTYLNGLNSNLFFEYQF